MIIDAHQHFWNTRRGDYGWIEKGDPILDRAYRPADLAPLMLQNDIDRTILVQAAPSLEETEYLLGIADAAPFVAGVIGWINFEDPSQDKHLRRLANVKRFRAIRPMIQDIADPGWMLRAEHDWAYRAIIELGLVFDALGKPRHLANFLELARRYPAMPMVIDHCMKPDIANHTPAKFQEWAEGMARLAELPQVNCKLSGLVTEAIADWTIEDLRPCAEHVIDVFGPDRLMWGSDWPVVRLRGEYDSWFHAARALTEDLPDAARVAIFGDTASRVYDLPI